jgi:hypothetical protein
MDGPGGEDALQKLRSHANAAEMTRAGLSRAVLAGHARSLGLAPTPVQVRRAEDAWLERVGVPRAERMAFFARIGMDAHEAQRLCEDEALALAVLEEAPRLFPDGPHADEGLAAEARFQGAWPR